jgi:adhesin/invasin
MHMPRAPLALGIVVAGLACSSDDGGGPNPDPLTQIEVIGGNNQVGVAGQPLAIQLSAIAHNIHDEGIGGVPVLWAAASGGGSVNPTTSVTNASGIATTTRTLGPNAGTQTTTATVAGLTPATFTAVAQIQGAVTIGSRFQSPLTDTVLATTVAQPVIAVVLNHTGGPVPGIIVTWSASGGGTVSQLVDTTDAGGESQVDYTFGATAGVYGAQAVVTGLVGSPVSYTLTATPGNPAVLVKTGGDNLTVTPGGQVIHTVTARDGHGNATNGVAIDWAVASGGGSIAPASNFTGGNGTASATRTTNGLGIYTATATAAGLGGSPATFTTTVAAVFNVSVGGPGGNAFTPQTATVSAPVTVTWHWLAGNVLPHNVTFAPTAGVPANIMDMTSGTASRMFTVPGTFNYQCTNHPGMTGTLTVN